MYAVIIVIWTVGSNMAAGNIVGNVGAAVYCLTSTPPTVTLPSETSYNLGISETKDVLPEPVAPIIPTVSPAFILRLIPLKTLTSDFCE